MKKTNFLPFLIAMVLIGGVISSCQKDETQMQKNSADSKDLKQVVIDCEECLEDWSESLVTFGPSYFDPQGGSIPDPNNIFLDVRQDATKIYYRLYVNGGEPIKFLRIDNVVVLALGDAPLTEYSWSADLPQDWEKCQVVNTEITVGGLYVHGIPYYDACIDYTLREPCGEWECSGSETAWSTGPRFTLRGNWATYTPYNNLEQTVVIYAGQNINVGTVHFSALANGEVTLTIDLNNGWRFNDVNESLKINTYNVPPSGNPAPGQFQYKYNATGDSYSVTLPDANIYAIHLDVTHCVMVN